MKRLHSLLVGLAVSVAAFTAALAASPAHADWSRIEEHWWEISIANQPCGFLHLIVEKDEDRLRTTTASTMRLNRDQTKVEVEMTSEFVETAKGEPVSAVVRQRMGGPELVTTIAFAKPKDAWVATVSDPTGTRDETLAGEWMTPQAVERFVNERMKGEAKEIQYRAVDVQSGVRVITTTMKRSGQGKAPVAADVVPGEPARDVPVTVWNVRNDFINLPSVEMHSEDGVLVLSTAQTGLGAIRSRLVGEKEAKAAAAGGNVEILVKSFVPARQPIRGAREKDRLVLRVGSLKDELPDLPTAGSQVAERVSPSEYRVVVDVSVSSDAPKSEFEDRRYRDPSALIDWESPKVKMLLATLKPRAEGQSSLDRADQLRRFVQGYVSDKNLGSAFASASETARTKSGDCSEHAVLLAALLRADGIPARLASGLVYADEFAGERNVWGWHVWTQACVDRGDGTYGWYDVDGTLPTRFDAAHCATGVSDLAGGAVDPMWAASIGLLGNLAIDVVDEKSPAPQPQRR